MLLYDEKSFKLPWTNIHTNTAHVKKLFLIQAQKVYQDRLKPKTKMMRVAVERYRRESLSVQNGSYSLCKAHHQVEYYRPQSSNLKQPEQLGTYVILQNSTGHALSQPH